MVGEPEPRAAGEEELLIIDLCFDDRTRRQLIACNTCDSAGRHGFEARAGEARIIIEVEIFAGSKGFERGFATDLGAVRVEKLWHRHGSFADERRTADAVERNAEREAPLPVCERRQRMDGGTRALRRCREMHRARSRRCLKLPIGVVVEILGSLVDEHNRLGGRQDIVAQLSSKSTSTSQNRIEKDPCPLMRQ